MVIYLLVIWFAYPSAIVMEGLGSAEGLSRSYHLVRGTWWRVFGIMAVFGILSVVIISVSSGVAYLIGLASERAGDLVEVLLSALAVNIIMIGSTLIYLDLRVRKEGFTVAGLAEEVGGEPPRTL